jgi:ubiquinone biosynthesis protein
MKIIRHISRLIYINFIFIKHALNSRQNSGVKIRRACEDLGPIFIKFGQLLSTRVDLLPDNIAIELAKLQDQVPAFCGQRAQQIIEKSLNKPITELFTTFDTNPLASASIAQVHAATMLDGKSVVVKVLRPQVKKHVTRDLDLLLFIAAILNLLWPGLRRFKPREVLLEIRKSIFDELDLMREAANASQLRRNFTDSHLLYVPEIYWSHTRHNILTIERISGIAVNNIAELRANNTDLRCLAERGVEIFFTQVFRDCFFHADMHPGNVWVSRTNPHNPQYLALDFGIMGTLSPNDQHYLAENFLAFFKRDYRRVAELHIESGWVPKHTRLDEFESAIRCVCEPIFARPLKDISFGKTLLRLFQTARRFDMQIQPQLILLQKTLISVEGLGRQLYPDLDLWHTAKPYLEEWMRRRVGRKYVMRKIKTLAPYWLEKLPDLPGLVYKAQLALAQNNTKTAAIRPSVWYYFILGGLSTALFMLMVLRIVNV